MLCLWLMLVLVEKSSLMQLLNATAVAEEETEAQIPDLAVANASRFQLPNTSSAARGRLRCNGGLAGSCASESKLERRNEAAHSGTAAVVSRTRLIFFAVGKSVQLALERFRACGFNWLVASEHRMEVGFCNTSHALRASMKASRSPPLSGCAVNKICL